MTFCDTVSRQVSLILPLACELAVGSAKCFSHSSGFPMIWGYTACGLSVYGNQEASPCPKPLGLGPPWTSSSIVCEVVWAEVILDGLGRSSRQQCWEALLCCSLGVGEEGAGAWLGAVEFTPWGHGSLSQPLSSSGATRGAGASPGFPSEGSRKVLRKCGVGGPCLAFLPGLT